MSYMVTKVNNKLETLQVWGAELDPFLEVLGYLWNESSISSDNQRYKKGIEVLLSVLKDYR